MLVWEQIAIDLYKFREDRWEFMMMRGFSRKIGLTALSILLLFGSLMSVPVSIVHAATDGFFEYEDLDGSTARINGYTGSNGIDVVIPPQVGGLTVVEIGPDAFRGKQLTSITIPNSVTTIGSFAFYNNRLVSLAIPNSVKSIGEGAFEFNELQDVTLPSNLTTIANFVFKDNLLNAVDIPDGVETIGSSAFEGNELMELNLPSSLTTIGNFAFYNNELTSLTIPDSVENIGEGAFEYNRLQDVTLPSSLITIENKAFQYNLLYAVDIPDGVETIGSSAFEGNELMELNLPSSLTTIGSSAFKSNKLSMLIIPSSVNAIEEDAFRNNSALSDVLILSDSINYLGDYIFHDSSDQLTLYFNQLSNARAYALGSGHEFQVITAELANLELSIPGLTFDPLERTYNLMTNATNVIVTPTAIVPFSEVKVAGEVVSHGADSSSIELVEETTTITIDVKAPDNSVEEYKIVFEVDHTRPSIMFSDIVLTPTNGNVTFTVSAGDTGSGLGAFKWAAGEQTTSFFATDGEDVEDEEFIVPANSTYTFYARDKVGNDEIAMITISNIDRDAPTINLTASPTTPTNGNVTVTVGTDGTNSAIDGVKWAAGSQVASFFAAGGQTVTSGSFDVTANGTYTVYARDEAGNEAVETIAIGNIDRSVPTLNLTASPTTPTNGNVTVTVDAEDTGSGLSELKWAAGNEGAAFFATGGAVIAGDEFIVTVNGTYTVYARDNAGNHVVETITISNIDRSVPTLNLTASPTTPTTGNVTITVDAEDTGSGLSELKWAAGNEGAGFFATGGAVIAGNEFIVTANSTYTVYARDDTGNEAVETITISNIDRSLPTIDLITNPTSSTNGNVTVTVGTDGTGSAIDSVKWAAGSQLASFFAAGGQTVTSGSFEATANGAYTVYARDEAGNEAVETITISNIDRSLPAIDLVASPTSSTNGNVTVTVAVYAISGISESKWIAGNEGIVFFATGGSAIVDNEFTVTANGTYTVYARDNAGNEAVETIAISSIDRVGPTIDLASSPTSSTNGNVTVTVGTDGTGSAIDSVKWAAGSQVASFFAAGGQTVTGGSFDATANGAYTVYARDEAGNEAVETITISNIDRSLPAINLIANPTSSTNGNVTVTVAVYANSGISETKWIAGNEGIAFFATGGAVIVSNEFTATANGSYTVYARDNAGNEAVETIAISNIVGSTPTPPSSPDPDDEEESPEDSEPRTILSIGPGVIIIEVGPKDTEEVQRDNGEIIEVVTLPDDIWDDLTENLDEDRPVIRVIIDNRLPDVEVHLPGERLAEVFASSPKAEFDMQLNGSSFQLKVTVLDLEQLATQLGIAVDDMNVIINISTLTGEPREAFILAAEGRGMTLLSQVIEFQLIVSGDDESVEITDFGGTYMTKSIVLDEQFANRNYMAVLYDPTGRTFTYVPAVMTRRSNGQQDAVMQMPHNSIYAIVETDRVEFSDMHGHWAESEVEQLASKRIVSGMTIYDYAPNRNITRAEFASLLVRALGIKTNRADTGDVFEDVAATSWYAAEVEAAFKAGLVSGISRAHFAPEAQITREQIAVMLMNARALVNDGSRTIDQLPNSLTSFVDASEVSVWARGAMSEAVTNKLVQGLSADRLAPAASATRAQAAVMLHRFMIMINFLD